MQRLCSGRVSGLFKSNKASVARVEGLKVNRCGLEVEGSVIYIGPCKVLLWDGFFQGL